MNRDRIWEYVMTIRENIKLELTPYEESHEQELIKHRKIVTTFEKKLLNAVASDDDIQLFIKSAIDCAVGEYPFEDLVSLYEHIKDDTSS
ncbi:MAG TPA: YnfE family protein [Candidatus Avamphibacillus intestinigallinarum]|nr:YnfE family protein [Candidatus Avamphibacillus intestinigallinarum]